MTEIPTMGRCPTEKELMPHHISKCKHGAVVSQCRCMSPNKTVLRVRCPKECENRDMSHNHFRRVCKHGTMIMQCRCPSTSKTTEIGPCPKDCKERMNDSQDHLTETQGPTEEMKIEAAKIIAGGMERNAALTIIKHLIEGSKSYPAMLSRLKWAKGMIESGKHISFHQGYVIGKGWTDDFLCDPLAQEKIR